MATWKLPLEKIVVARWLKDIGRRLGESCAYIPNGLDFDRFGCDCPPETRKRDHVAMLYANQKWKGSTDGLTILANARKSLPNLSADIFGVDDPPKGLPTWINYHQNPSQRELRNIYNRASIFLAPSWAEGWGLPPSEAAMSGCALLATDIGGHREYARHQNTALMFPAHDVAKGTRSLMWLVKNDGERIRLACQGNKFIQQFTWDRAIRRLTALF